MVRQMYRWLSVALVALCLAACGAPSETTVEPDDVASVDVAPSADEAFADVEPTPTVVPDASAAVPTLREGAAKAVYAVGDVARVNAFLVRVDEATTATQSDVGTAAEGQQFLLVKLTLENTTAEAQDIAALLQMSAEDGAGAQYPLDVNASLDFLTVNGSVGAGESATATVGYSVPKAAQGLKWVFRTTAPDAAQGLKETGKAIFAVGE